MFTIQLRNIKGVQEMEFHFPEGSGVYLLTGSNGSGKTSLLTALHRLGDKLAFKGFEVGISGNLNGAQIDNYSRASIVYTHDNENVTYRKKNQRWVPQPRSNSSILEEFNVGRSVFIRTTGNRFFTQTIAPDQIRNLQNAEEEIKNALNRILDTEKFRDLRYAIIPGRRGRRPRTDRRNKLYVIQEGENIYSEKNFSLGERLLLNILENVNNIAENSLLLIDELELALHPVAQVKFYDYLKEKSEERSLRIIISTHSSTLIRHASRNFYLENACGRITVYENCYPAYILRTVASREDCRPDFVFFVEDDMARIYLEAYLRKFLNDENKLIDCKVLPVGGFKEVVKLLINYRSLNFPQSHTQAFLDNDVETYFNYLDRRGNDRTDKENEQYRDFINNANYISYLSITPELGVWEWIVRNVDVFRSFLDERYGQQTFNLNDEIRRVTLNRANEKPDILHDDTEQEKKEKLARLIKWAKNCFHDISETINNMNAQISVKEVEKDMIVCYVNNHYVMDDLRRKLNPILRRN